VWMKIDSEFPRHPKIRAFVSSLKRQGQADKVSQNPHAWILNLWIFAQDFAPDGRLAQFSDSDIAAGCGWDGDVPAFIKALSESHFLDSDDGHWIVHDWWENNGKYQQRARDKAKSYRERSRNVPVTLPERSGDVPVTLPPNRRDGGDGRDETDTNSPPPAAPATPSRFPLPSWVFSDWKEFIKGDPPGELMGKVFRPLLRESGHDLTRKRYRNYLQSVDPVFASPSQFSRTFGQWDTIKKNGKNTKPPRDSMDLGDGRRMDCDLTTEEGRKRFKELYP
jgi:hypothetical protein